MSNASVRRIVTGHDSKGRAVVIEDTRDVRVARIGGDIGPVFHEIWTTREMPARIDRASGEPAEAGIVLPPPPGGTRIRVVDFPPDTEAMAALSAEDVHSLFASIGAGGAEAFKEGQKPPHPFMHRTETIDYGLILDGEITLMLDEGEVHMTAGDIVVQRGTNHGWANRSQHNCRIAFVLIDGRFDPDIA